MIARARKTQRLATVVGLSRTRTEIPRPAGSRPAKSYLPEDGLPRTDPTGVATIDASHHLPSGGNLFPAALLRYDMRVYVVDNGGQWTHREWRVLKYLGAETKIAANDTRASGLDC